MKKILLILLSIFSFFIASCSDSGTTTDDTCKPECKAYETCNTEGNCDLKEGMCADSSDCSADKPVCDANECIAESTDCNSECDSSYQVCNAGACETREGFCVESSECSGDTPICSAGHICVADNNGKTVTLRELKDNGIEGNKYTTHGIVTAKDSDGFYMQDDSDRGIYVYMNLSGGEFMAQEIGDKVTVTGVYKIYYGFNELTYYIDEEIPQNSIDLDITTDSSNNPLPEFKEISIGVKTLENYESMLVKLSNPNFTIKKRLQDSGNRDYDLIDSLSGEFTVNDSLFNLESLEGELLSKMQGVLKYHKDEYKLLPRVETDVEKAVLACDPVCEVFEECVNQGNDLKCVLASGMCETQVDCEFDYQTCDDHVCTTPIAQNLVPNGSLEDWYTVLPEGSTSMDSKAEGWIYEYDNQALTTATKESTNVIEGSFSGKVKKIAADENPSNKQNEFLSPAFPIDTTKEYTISMKILDNDVNAKARIYFKFYDAEGYSNGMSNMTIAYTTNSPDWKEYTYPDSWDIFAGIDPGTESGQLGTIRTMRVGVRLYDDEGTGTGYIYLDDVQVKEKLFK